MQVEHLANNLPLTVELDEIEEIRETMPSPVVQVNTDACACNENVNRTNLHLDVLGCTVTVIPVKQYVPIMKRHFLFVAKGLIAKQKRGLCGA